MSRRSYVPSAENADLVATGEIVLYQFGKPASRELRCAERAEYEAAKAAGYIVRRWTPNETSNAFFLWCEGTGAPFVEVRAKRRYATVSIDAITMLPVKRLGSGAPAAIQVLFGAEAALPTYCAIGRVYSYCERIPLAEAGRVAAALRDIARAFPPEPDATPTTTGQEDLEW